MSEKLHVAINDKCCQSLIENNEDLQLLDSCFEISSKLSTLVKSTLYYIRLCQYVQLDVPEIQGQESEFLKQICRGRLGHPPAELYDLSQYLFAFFKTREKKCCSKLFLEAYETTHFKFNNIQSILGRFNNCFYKSFANDLNDKLKHIKDEK